MAVIVPEPTPEQLVDAIASRLKAELSDPGFIIAAGEYVKDNRMAAQSMRREEDGVKGVAVQWKRYTEIDYDDADEFYNTATHIISIRVFKQFLGTSSASDLEESRSYMMKTLWEVGAIIRNHVALGFNPDEVEAKPFTMIADLAEEPDEEIGVFHVGEGEVQVECKIFITGCP